MVKECDATRVPGRMERICGRSFMLSAGSRYMVMTSALLKSVAKMSPWRMVALPGPSPATPAAWALALACLTISGLYSMPMARAPNFFAAAMAILPSPAPRSITRSLEVTCAMVSMRSTTSSGVGTQITSLPAWPTCGSNFCAAAGEARSEAKRRAVNRRVIAGSGGMKGRESSRKSAAEGETPRLLTYSLQHVGGVVGEARPFTARERDVPGVGPVLHAIDDVGEARAAFGEVRRVDLRDVAQAHHLRARPGARHQRLHLLGREVLRLVDDQPLVDEGAPAHEVERLDLDARAHQVPRRRAPPLAARLVGGVEDIEVVLERPHPGLHLLLLGAGQEADVLAQRHRDARHDDLAVALLVEHLREPGGEREQRLAGAGLAEQRDEVDGRVHEQVEREVLLAVARGDAPHRVLGVRVVAQRLEHGDATLRLLDQRIERLVPGLVEHELVHVQLRDQRPAHAVVRVPVLLPRLDVAPVRVPEILRQRAHAGVEEVGVLEHLVVEVILGVEPQRPRLDAHVDVLRHQHHFALRLALLEGAHDGKDLVVGLARGERRGQAAVHRLGLQKQPAARLLSFPGSYQQALLYRFQIPGDDLVEEAARLARVARDVREPALVLVELLQGGDRQVDVVLVEAEEARRIVHEHVGVEHEELLHFGLARGAGVFHGGGEGGAGSGGGRVYGEVLFDIIGL